MRQRHHNANKAAKDEPEQSRKQRMPRVVALTTASELPSCDPTLSFPSAANKHPQTTCPAAATVATKIRVVASKGGAIDLARGAAEADLDSQDSPWPTPAALYQTCFPIIRLPFPFPAGIQPTRQQRPFAQFQGPGPHGAATTGSRRLRRRLQLPTDPPTTTSLCPTSRTRSATRRRRRREVAIPIPLPPPPSNKEKKKTTALLHRAISSSSSKNHKQHSVETAKILQSLHLPKESLSTETPKPWLLAAVTEPWLLLLVVVAEAPIRRQRYSASI